MITCQSAAKINLSLDILSRRDDGYHELQSIAHTVGLWDTLTFDFDAAPGISLQCNREDLCSDNNLCIKAAHTWLDAARQLADVSLHSLAISLEKQIPSGAGLGGGSGNAAATLLAINRYFDNLLDDTQLIHLAATLGADVPFFLRGGCALFEGIGERLTSLPNLNAWVLLVQPEMSLSTAMVYNQWDNLNRKSFCATGVLQGAVMAGNLPLIGQTLSNDLRAAAQAAGVDIEAIIAQLGQNDALGVEMTGSGSAVFALFDTEEKARDAAQCFREKRLPTISFVEVAPLCAQGVIFAW